MLFNSKHSLLLIFLLLSINGASAQEQSGVIFGTILKRGLPFAHRMHLHYGSGLFFGAQPSGNNGNFAFQNMPFGEYFAILGPIEEIPFSWRTNHFSLDKNNPVCYLNPIDPFLIRLLFPTDGASISPEKISKENPLIFRWTPYAALDITGESKAEYLIEIFSVDKKQYYKSERMETTVFHFDGLFPDGTKMEMQSYQWCLIVFPKQSNWTGKSYVRDLLPGDLGEIHIHEGKYMTLEIPKWYESTIAKFDLMNFLDIAYQIEFELSGVYPFHGKKKGAIIYDPTINWAHSGLWVGLPIHFGKGWFAEGNAPWFGFFHEMGHDFQTGAIKKFSDLTVHQDTGIPIYSGLVEGFASIAHFYAGYVFEKSKDHRGINLNAYQAMMRDVKERRNKYLQAMNLYEESGAPFNRINPDMVDGMLIQICDKHGWAKLSNFFRYFHDDGPLTENIINKANNEKQRITIIIAALSAAMEFDLKSQFQQWNFPINDQYYETILKKLAK